MNAKRKLFLSWMAVREALVEGNLQDADLDTCLFCTSVGELILGQAFDQRNFRAIMPHLLKAAAEGRLAYFDKFDHVNGLSIACVNDLLKLNGVAPLNCPAEGTLTRLLYDLAVPQVEDFSIPVLFAGQPTTETFRAARQQQAEDDLALVSAGARLSTSFSNWMVDIKTALAMRP